MQSRFASFAVINLRWNLHAQECAPRRAHKKRRLQKKMGSVDRPNPQTYVYFFTIASISFFDFTMALLSL